MWFLISPFEYFNAKNSIRFVYGFIAVFFNGGITLMTALLTTMWVSMSDTVSVTKLLNELTIGLYAYVFLSSLLMWMLISVVFYIFLLWDGREPTEFFTTLSLCGLGFVPLVIGSVIEFCLTFILTTQQTAEPPITTTHVLISGDLGFSPALGMIVIHVFTLVWSAYIWSGGLVEVGTASKQKSILLSLAVSLLFVSELWYLATL